MSVPIAYLGIILIWATTPLAIKWSGEEAGFLFGVTLRMLLGYVICLLLLWALLIGYLFNGEAITSTVLIGTGAILLGLLSYQYLGRRADQGDTA